MMTNITKRHSNSSKRSDDGRNHQESMSEQEHNMCISISSSTNTKCPITWKLYDNPFFSTTSNPCCNSGDFHFRRQLQGKYNSTAKLIHPRPDLSKKLMSSSSTTAISMDASLQNQELKAELDLERRVRKKMEALNKRVSRELAEEKREKQGLQRSCDKLRAEMWRVKGEMQRIIRKHMEDENKMLRMANLFREERHKLHNEYDAQSQPQQPIDCNRNRNPIYYNRNRIRIPPSSYSTIVCVGESKRSASITANVNVGSSNCNYSNNVYVPVPPSSMCIQRKPQPENPHIKRGIKGFVEFPNHVVKLKAMAINGSTNSKSHPSGSRARNRDMGTKLECHKTQLGILLKHRIQSLPSNPLIIT